MLLLFCIQYQSTGTPIHSITIRVTFLIWIYSRVDHSHHYPLLSSPVEPPVIAEPPSPHVQAPGNCKDVTNTTIASEQVGLDLCVQAGPDAQLYLNCITETGTPAPTFSWFKDGVEINSSSDGYTIFPNGTLLMGNILLPVDAAIAGVPDVTGLYTCVAVNLAGSTDANATSYVVPFGSELYDMSLYIMCNILPPKPAIIVCILWEYHTLCLSPVDISLDAVSAHYAPLHLQLFNQLHASILESGTNDDSHIVVLLGYGKTLKYGDYYPGRFYDGGEQSIPPNIMENMFDLVNIIPNAESLVMMLTDSHHLSETYEYLVNELKVSQPETPQDTLDSARDYLQAQVSDIGDIANEPMPRLSLYLMYKNRYYQKKLEVENQIEYQRNRLSLINTFSEWYDRNGQILEAEVDDAYIKWEMFGYKRDVEEWLDVLNLQDYSESLDEARALLFTTRMISKFKDEKVYYPVEFNPDQWFELLGNRYDTCVVVALKLSKHRISWKPGNVVLFVGVVSVVLS